MTRIWDRPTIITALALGCVALCLIFSVPRAQGMYQADPETAEPGQCQIEPRAVPLFGGTPPAVQVADQPDPDSGTPADAAIVRGITSTVTEVVACANTAQPLGAFALVTDDFLAREFVGDGAADVIESSARLERPATAPDPVDFLDIVAIEAVVLFPDERVGAVVVTENATTTFHDYLVFVEGDTRWLIDASFPLDTTPATPSP